MKKRIWSIAQKSIRFVLLAVIVLAAAWAGSSAKVDVRDGDISIGISGVAYAETPDHTVDGAEDDIEVQYWLDQLPSTGGRLVLFAGAYDFHVTVTRACDNITIAGTGKGTVITTVGVAAPFTCTGQTGWTFTNFACDDTPAYDKTNGVTSDTIIDGIWIGGVYTVDLPSPERFTKTVTYVVATSDATDSQKSQADMVLTGTTGSRVDHTTLSGLFDDIHTLIDAGTIDYAEIKIVGSNIWVGGATETHIGNFVLDGGGVIIHNATTEKFMTCTGALGDDSVLLAADLGVTGRTWTASSDITAWLNQGGAYYISQEHAANDLVNGLKRAEIQRVEEIVYANPTTTVTMCGFSGDSYGTANTATVKEVLWLKNITIKNLRIQSDAADAEWGDLTDYRGMVFTYCDRVTLEDVFFDRIYACGAEFLDCMDIYAEIQGFGAGDSGEGTFCTIGNATSYAKIILDTDSARQHVLGGGTKGGPKFIHVHATKVTGDCGYGTAAIDCHFVPADFWTISGLFYTHVAGIGAKHWTLQDITCYLDNGNMCWDRSDGDYTEEVTIKNIDLHGGSSVYTAYSDALKKIYLEGITIHRENATTADSFIMYESALPASCEVYMTNITDLDTNGTYSKIHIVAAATSCKFYGENLKISKSRRSGLYLEGFGGGFIKGGAICNNDYSNSNTQGYRADVSLNNCAGIVIQGIDLRKIDASSYPRYGIEEYGTSDNNYFVRNILSGHTVTGILKVGTFSIVKDNEGYIGRGEERTYAVTITAGVENTTTYWQNPFAQNVWASEITLNITTASDNSPTYDVKLDTDGTGVPSGTTFLDAVPDTAGTYWSWGNLYGAVACGVQTAYLQLASNTSTSDWIGLCIEDDAGLGIVGVIHITVIGQ